MRLRTIPCLVRSHANTSPGAAPGSTTRFLLSAVNVIVGLSHSASLAVKASLLFRCRDNFRVECHMALLRFRFGDKFAKLSTGAKARDRTYSCRCFAAVWQALSARACAERFVPGRTLVWTLQRTQRRMVGKRAIQLRVVRSFFRAVSFLASLAGPATNGNPKSEIRNPKKTKARCVARDSGAPFVVAGSAF